MSTTRAYKSSNGDTWDLVRDDVTKRAHVSHTPAPTSGGRVSNTPLDDFLNVEPHSPQHKAISSFVAPLAGAETAAGIRGYVHDPKEEGGPYIAVVLDADDTPTVTLHRSYAEAERQLEGQLADLRQTSLSHRLRGR